MLLDIGAGILLAILTTKLFNLSLTITFLVGGIVFILLMDIDYIFHLYKGGSSRDAYKHRDLLHYPFLYIPLGMMVISFLNVAWAVLFGLCSFAHFLHDSIGTGWGIQWLYPFKTDHYTFFYCYQPRHMEKLPKKIVYILKHEDIDMFQKKYGDEEWVKNIYWHWHPYAIVEFLIFITALIVLYFYIK